MQVMTEDELHETLSKNIKKYRKGKFTQEQLAEKIGVSSQNINDIEGKRRWPREATLVKIAEALDIEVYQLFVQQDCSAVNIEETDENQKIRQNLKIQLVADFRKSMIKMLDKWEDKLKKRGSFVPRGKIIRLDDRGTQNPFKKSVLTIPKMGTTLQVCM